MTIRKLMCPRPFMRPRPFLEGADESGVLSAPSDILSWAAANLNKGTELRGLLPS